MASLSSPQNDMISTYPDVQYKAERVFLGKDNHVTFIKQFVYNVHDFSSQYGNDISISYTAGNIIGLPTKFPEYGDFPQTFVMRTYGSWWDKAPSRSIDYMPQNNLDIVSHDYIDIEYIDEVYPIRVSIYETYNPGSVIRIWAQDSLCQWFQLWSGPPQIIPQKPRIFSPRLKLCVFKTKMLRLEFNHSQLDYYTELDAVLLIGTKELVTFRTTSSTIEGSLTDLLYSEKVENRLYPEATYNIDVHNLTPDYDTAEQDLINVKRNLSGIKLSENTFHSKLLSEVALEQLYHCVPPFREGCHNFQQFLQEDFSKFINIQDHSDKFEEPPPCDSFSILPDETILKILRNLDLKSLYRMRRVNKHFNNLARDALLYTCLNLKPYWNSFDAYALNCLASRCKYLRQLDLSWCGNHDMFSTVHIRNFLKACGSLLTHLRLNCCEKVDDSVVGEISSTCKNLKELSLRSCRDITDKGFSYLHTLESLERLDLYRTYIESSTLCNIVKNNPRLRHLNIAGVYWDHFYADSVAIELGTSCPDLESVDFWKVSTLTWQGIEALANCKNLREVDLSWCNRFGTIYNSRLHKLFSSCQHLEKVFLASFQKLTDRDLKELALCKHLKQLDLLGALSLTPEMCSEILINCPELELLDLSFCDYISDSQIKIWRQEYPHIAIKRIKTTENEVT